MNIEAVLLTGGASRRMGVDKASLAVRGKPLAQSIAEAVASRGIPVTVLGRHPLEGYAFVADEEEYAGPLAALSRYVPTRDAVLVLSCDLPRFDAEITRLLSEMGDCDAVVAEHNGRLQPLLGLYRANSFEKLRELRAAGEKRMIAWLNSLNVLRVTETDLAAAGLNRDIAKNVNTPADLDA